MKIIAVNAGSSSLKFKLFEYPGELELALGLVERIGHENAAVKIEVNGKKEKRELPVKDHITAVNLVLESLVTNGAISHVSEIAASGHRVVQGGELFNSSVLITDKVIEDIRSLSDLAPLHNPANLMGIEAFRKALPKAPAFAIFDTVFHSTMESDAYMYAIPLKWYNDYGVRKYGFHGISHQYVSLRCAALLERKESKIVVCHIGNGASLCAVKNGQSVDTTMGLTPLEGIPMGTRSGNVDPTIIELVARKEGKTFEEVLNDLNKKSGYLGLSQLSNDSRDVENAYFAGDKNARLAIDVQAKRIVDYIASYYVYMGGLDAICFTAGIGENSSLLRKLIADKLACLGVEIDRVINDRIRGVETLLSTPSSKIKLYLIPTNEEAMIVREVIRLYKN